MKTQENIYVQFAKNYLTNRFLRFRLFLIRGTFKIDDLRKAQV
jgi:hypothetical protein